MAEKSDNELLKYLYEKNPEIIKRIGEKKAVQAMRIIGTDEIDSGAKYIVELLREVYSLDEHIGESVADEIQRIIGKTELERGDVENLGGRGNAYRSTIKNIVMRLCIRERKMFRLGGIETIDGFTTRIINNMGAYIIKDPCYEIHDVETYQEMSDYADQLMTEKQNPLDPFTVGFSRGMQSHERKALLSFDKILGPLVKPDYLDSIEGETVEKTDKQRLKNHLS